MSSLDYFLPLCQIPRETLRSVQSPPFFPPLALPPPRATFSTVRKAGGIPDVSKHKKDVPPLWVASLSKGGKMAGELTMDALRFRDTLLGPTADMHVESCVTVISYAAEAQRVVQWVGFIVGKTVFFQFPSNVTIDTDLFQKSLVSLFDLATEKLAAENLIISLDKSRPELSSLVKAFMYVGFEAVTPQVYKQKPEFLLLGCAL